MSWESESESGLLLGEGILLGERTVRRMLSEELRAARCALLSGGAGGAGGAMSGTITDSGFVWTCYATAVANDNR